MTFRRRKWDGKVQSWFRKTWNADTHRYDFEYGWRDEPDDAIERFRETRDPAREGMIVLHVDELDDGPPVLSVAELLDYLQRPTGD